MNNNDLEQIKNVLRATHKGFKCTLVDGNVLVESSVFTSEDKVAIFKGDDPVYFVHKQALIIHTLNVHNYLGDSNCKYFSTKEAAEKWIEENKPRKPIYIDPDNGDEFIEWDTAFYFSKYNYTIGYMMIVAVTKENMRENEKYSKKYNSLEKCEIALAEFIANKHSKTLIDKE